MNGWRTTLVEVGSYSTRMIDATKTVQYSYLYVVLQAGLDNGTRVVSSGADIVF